MGTALRQRKTTKQDGLLLEAIGRTIYDARMELGLTQTELARRARVSRFQMCKHESGTAEMPITRLVDICRHLKVRPFEMMRSAIKDMEV